MYLSWTVNRNIKYLYFWKYDTQYCSKSWVFEKKNIRTYTHDLKSNVYILLLFHRFEVYAIFQKQHKQLNKKYLAPRLLCVIISTLIRGNGRYIFKSINTRCVQLYPYSFQHICDKKLPVNNILPTFKS